MDTMRCWLSNRRRLLPAMWLVWKAPIYPSNSRLPHLCSRCFFFFQAEDGIRDLTVTGVQTCALPISARRGRGTALAGGARVSTAPAGYGRVLDLVTRVRGVRGAMLVAGDDGLVVAEQLMEGIKGPAVAALAASLASRLRRALEAAGVGAGQFWHLQAEQGALLVVTAASGVLVVAVAEPDVNVGLVRLELLRAAEAGG